MKFAYPNSINPVDFIPKIEVIIQKCAINERDKIRININKNLIESTKNATLPPPPNLNLKYGKEKRSTFKN